LRITNKEKSTPKYQPEGLVQLGAGSLANAHVMPSSAQSSSTTGRGCHPKAEARSPRRCWLAPRKRDALGEVKYSLSARNYDRQQMKVSRRQRRGAANARGRKRICRNALRSAIHQLSLAREDASVHGHDALPRNGRADGDIVPRVRTRVGIRTAKYAREDAPIQIDEVVQKNLGS
jgi:hypothetical protein